MVFLVALGFLIYSHVGYPHLLWVLAGFWGRSWYTGNNVPFMTIVVAAYQEALVIGERIAYFLEIEYPEDRLHIVIASDASTDRVDVRWKPTSRTRLELQ